jgi:hypothetical protein
MLIRVTGRHLENGLTDDVAHVGGNHHPHEPSAALLQKIRVM